MDRLVVGKSRPTTKVTVGDVDWPTPMTPLLVRDPNQTTPLGGSFKPPHGLLTPQNSKEDVLAEGQVSYVDVSNQKGSSTLRTTDEATMRCSTENSCETMSIEYENVAIQTSIASTPSSVLECTPPPSPATRSPSATPKPRRNRKSKSSYVLEGERLAKELEEDLRHVARRRDFLERQLKKLERQERDLQSFLVPGPVKDGDSDAETEIVETDDDELPGPVREPQTPTDRKIPARDSAPSIPKAASFSGLSTPTRPHGSATAPRLGATKSAPSRSVRVDKLDSASSMGYTSVEGSLNSDRTSIKSGAQSLRAEEGPEPVRDPSTYLVWLDLETNDAIRPTKHIRILEIAICITDKNYIPLDGGISYLVHWPLTAEEVAAEMSPNVVKMHRKSGLLADYEATPPERRRTLAQVERRVCNYLEKHEIKPHGAMTMAGAGIAFDRGVVRQHMPKLDAYFGHQIFDTTSIWHLIRRKYNRAKRHHEECAHRAWQDIMGSMKEAKKYSNTFLKHPRDVCWPST